MSLATLSAGRSVIDPDPNLVSPGILGFLAFFFLAIALYFLVRSMNGRLRRMNFRASEIEAAEAARVAQRAASDGPAEKASDERDHEAGTGSGAPGR